MAELNDKLITYGNLSTFYDKLQEQGLGGNAIEDASVLPDASANKNKFVRLESDKKVYVSECSTSTEEVNAPDAQQIDNATVDFEGTEYIYKGFFNLICNDGIYPTKISFWQLGSYPEYAIGTLQASAITNISDGDWAYGYDEVSINNDTATMPLEISDVEMALREFTPTSISIVKQTVTVETWAWQPLTDNATDDDIDAMFSTPEPEPSNPVVKRVLMKTPRTGYELSIKEGLVNFNDETIEYSGGTYYKWVKYEEHWNGESKPDVNSYDGSWDTNGGVGFVILTTTLNPTLPFSEESPEIAYYISTDGEESEYPTITGAIYPKEAIIYKDGSITYEE